MVIREKTLTRVLDVDATAFCLTLKCGREDTCGSIGVIQIAHVSQQARYRPMKLRQQLFTDGQFRFE